MTQLRKNKKQNKTKSAIYHLSKHTVDNNRNIERHTQEDVCKKKRVPFTNDTRINKNFGPAALCRPGQNERKDVGIWASHTESCRTQRFTPQTNKNDINLSEKTIPEKENKTPAED